MADFKNIALELAGQGFAVFPLKRHKKTPLQNGGFKNATADPEIIKEVWARNPLSNIGISCGQPSGGLLVIDLDIKEDEGIDGRESLREWEATNGSFPDTVTAVTGSGGQHLYFKVHKEYRPKVGILPGVDIRCDGSYVVAPGSIHENGNPYFWDVSPDDMEIAEANDSVIALIEKHDEQAEGEAFNLIAEKVQKGSRVATMVRLVGSLCSKGLSDESIKATVRIENERLCSPVLTEDELNKEVFPAIKRFEKGVMYETIPLPGQVKHKEEKKKLKSVTAKELLNKKLPPITFRVDEMLADGVTMLCAKSKEGKSWLCLQMAVAVANGEPFLGYRTTQCGVVYFDFENGENLTQDRLRKVLHGADAPANLHIVHEADRFGKGFKEELEDFLEENPDIGLVIIDVLQHVRYLKEKGQTDYDCDYNTLTELKQFCDKKPMAIICVHHLKKAGNENDPFDNVLGSTALMGAADETIILGRQKRSDQTFTLSITGRTLKGGDFKARFDKERYEWSMMGEVDDLILSQEDYERNPVVKAIKYLMSQQNEWQGTAADIADVIKKEGFDAGTGKSFGETSVGRYISSYEDKLLLFDKIAHTDGKRRINGATPTRYHLFSRFPVPGCLDE